MIIKHTKNKMILEFKTVEDCKIFQSLLTPNLPHCFIYPINRTLTRIIRVNNIIRNEITMSNLSKSKKDSHEI